MERVSELIRGLLLEQCQTDKKVTVFLSAGVDSNAILHAFLLNDIKPTVTSFCLDGQVSSDFRAAQRIAKKLQLQFIPVFLPTDTEQLLDDVRFLMENYLLRKKAEIEAFWPCWYAIREAHEQGQRVIANGLCAGGLFGDDRECSIRGNGPDGEDAAWLDEVREEKFSKPNYGQAHAWGFATGERQITVISPYRDKRFREILRGVSYRECNSPRQKEPLRAAFPEMFGVKNHQNLQLGDSGISKLFTKLLDHPVNTKGYRSVVGVYNELARGLA